MAVEIDSTVQVASKTQFCFTKESIQVETRENASCCRAEMIEMAKPKMNVIVTIELSMKDCLIVLIF
jgi:hypothetical protein